MLKPQNLFPVSVDPVIFSIIDDTLHVLLKKRVSDTFNNMLALPGGLVEKTDTSLEAAIERVLANKTGAKVNYMEQLYTRTGHDPRGPTMAIAYIALVAQQEVINGAVWTPVGELSKHELAFDHKEVIANALKRLTNKVNYSTIPMHLLPQPFTLPKLQQVYEVLLGEKLDKSTFRKKIAETGVLEETGNEFKGGAFRPAKLYRLAKSDVYNFASNIVR